MRVMSLICRANSTISCVSVICRGHCALMSQVLPCAEERAVSTFSLEDADGKPSSSRIGVIESFGQSEDAL